MIVDYNRVKRLRLALLGLLEPAGLTDDLLMENADWFLMVGSDRAYAMTQAKLLIESVMAEKLDILQAFSKVIKKTFHTEQFQQSIQYLYGLHNTFYHPNAQPTLVHGAQDQQEEINSDQYLGLSG